MSFVYRKMFMEVLVLVLFLTDFLLVQSRDSRDSILQWNNTKCRTTKYKYKCYFPFEYKDVSYYGCTRAGGKEHPWCYTEEQTTIPPRGWDYCDGNCPLGQPEIKKHVEVVSIHSNQIRLSCTVVGSPNPSLQWRGNLRNGTEVIIKEGNEIKGGPPENVRLEVEISSDTVYEEIWCRAENSEGKVWGNPVFLNLLTDVNTTSDESMALSGVSDISIWPLNAIVPAFALVVTILIITVVVLVVKLKTLRKIMNRDASPSVTYNKTTGRAEESDGPEPDRNRGLVNNSIYKSAEDRVYHNTNENNLYDDLPVLDSNISTAELIDNELYNSHK